ncbi:MAG: hypothetical protein KKH47_03465, partial [Proteobacteria bacterium]|nr:hypothetical protein [Pseudomonadota bacterium]
MDNSTSKQKAWSIIVNYINLLNLFYATSSMHCSQLIWRFAAMKKAASIVWLFAALTLLAACGATYYT